MASILIVDDQSGVVRSLKTALELEGHSVTTALSGTRALAELASSEADVVILDLALPDLDGLELLERIRSAYPGIRAIAMSGDEELLSRAATADAVLSKPFTSVDILRAIGRAPGG